MRKAPPCHMHTLCVCAINCYAGSSCCCITSLGAPSTRLPPAEPPVSVSAMKTAVLLCCLLAAVAAAPQRPNRNRFGGNRFGGNRFTGGGNRFTGGGNRFVPNRVQSFGQPSTANGIANSNVVTGTSSGQGGSSTITQVSAQAGVSTEWRAAARPI